MRTVIQEREVKPAAAGKRIRPGNVFLGVTHRLDRPTTGVVLFAKTSKALERLNRMFSNGEVHKTYWCIVENVWATDGKAGTEGNLPPKEQDLTDFLLRNEKQNRSYAYREPRQGAKEARLHYRVIASTERYALLEVQLFTGRHHQIRCQLANIGLPIKGDLKYGAPRSNPDGGISLHSRQARFVHPVSKQEVVIVAPVPDDTLWKALAAQLA